MKKKRVSLEELPQTQANRRKCDLPRKDARHGPAVCRECHPVGSTRTARRPARRTHGQQRSRPSEHWRRPCDLSSEQRRFHAHVYNLQDIVRIDLSCNSGKIADNPAFVAACANAKAKSGRLHLLGLVSDGGVHSHQNHLYAMLAAAQKHQVPHTFVHFFGDGRDTSPTSGGKRLWQSSDLDSQPTTSCNCSPR